MARRIRADAEPVWAHRVGVHGFPLDAVFLQPGDFVPDDVPVADSLLEPIGSGAEGEKTPGGADGTVPPGPSAGGAGDASTLPPPADILDPKGRTVDEVNGWLEDRPRDVVDAVLAREADVANGGRNRSGIVKGPHAHG